MKVWMKMIRMIQIDNKSNLILYLAQKMNNNFWIKYSSYYFPKMIKTLFNAIKH